MPVTERKGKLTGGDDKKLSRLARMRVDRKDEDYEPPLPNIDGMMHVLGYLFEIGPVMTGAMGPAPITHTEIDAWQANTGVDLAAWEARVMRRLSIEYIGEMQRAEKPDCPPPWTPPEVPQLDRAAVSRKVQNAMRSFMLSRKTEG